MSHISYVNGEYIDHKNASVSIDDRGYVFSDGVYEVVLIINNCLLDWEEHCTRLRNSIAGLKINYNFTDSELADTVNKLLEKNNLKSAMLYLQITRGVAKRNHSFPDKNVLPSVVMTVYPCDLPSGDKYQKGGSAITTADLRWKKRNYKTISLLPNILAKQEAVDASADEAILIEDTGIVTEGSAANFFIINDKGQVRTHPANDSILGGITRIGILQVARENNIEIIEQPFNKAEMMEAKEAFITSTTKHIMPIVKIDGKDIGDGTVGDVTQNLMKLYREYINKQI